MEYLNYVLLVLVLCFHCDALSSCEKEITIELGLEAKSLYHYKEPTYDRSLLCEWRFLARNPSTQIVYQLTNISVDCGDTLIAFTNETQFTAPRICGIGKDIETAVTPAGELKLCLNSDKTVHEHEKGFTLHMIAAKGNDICPQQPINVTFVKQQIASPRFPNPYAANLQCRYILTAPSGVVLTFEYIDVEKHKDCPLSSCCDQIIIYEGLASENKKLASICGSDMFHPNLTYESLGKTLTLELRTDNRGPKRGFVATVQAISRPSARLITPRSPLTVTAFPTRPNSESCKDDPSAHCELYNATVLCDPNGIYYTWARKSCPDYCGLCRESCKDDPSAQCELYSATALCDPNGVYYIWARSSCPDYCGLCTDTTVTFSSTTSTSLGPSDPTPVCKDTINCRVYNPSMICITSGTYYEWSQKNCPAYCGYCQAQTRIVPCSDKLTNCDEYPPDLCTNEFHRLWREDNCRKFCGMC